MRISQMDPNLIAHNLLAADPEEHPYTTLHAVVDALVLCDVMRERAVAQLRKEGQSWAQIGDVLGVTRQAAQQRYGR